MGVGGSPSSRSGPSASSRARRRLGSPLPLALFIEHLSPPPPVRWYSTEALRLRIFHLLNAPRGAESHTVLVQVRGAEGCVWGGGDGGSRAGGEAMGGEARVRASPVRALAPTLRAPSPRPCRGQDIPGVAAGTIPNRLDGTLLKFVPKSECFIGLGGGAT